MNEIQKRTKTVLDGESILQKAPISKEKIFKIMLYLTYIIAGMFFLKNVIGKAWRGSIIIGISITVFSIVVITMKVIHTKEEYQQFAVAMGLIFLVFIISINSGDYYSDDFPLYLAVIGLTGLYLRPNYTKIQCFTVVILLPIQYFLHPEKSENLSQFLLCLAMFVVASFTFYLAIKRGRAFIQMSQKRAEQAEELLKSMQNIGEELEQNFESVSVGIENMKRANTQLEGNAKDLKEGSTGIMQGAREVSDTCDNVQNKIQVTEKQIDALNGEVKSFENTMEQNRQNMKEMGHQMELVKGAIKEASDIFHIMDQQMHEICDVTQQLDSISSSTTMLALNASIEAARVGQMGAGFAVVASKVQDLAVDSNKCSSQVTDVVKAMQNQLQKTSGQLKESTETLNISMVALSDLQGSFERLNEQFDLLYHNIGQQNHNINQVDNIFKQLKEKISEMSSYSQENQASVEEVVEVIKIYKNNMWKVIDDTQQVHELSSSMLELSRNNRS